MRRRVVLLCALMLGGCAGLNPPAPASDPRAALTPERVARLTRPTLFAELPARGAGSTLTPLSTNGDVTTWGRAGEVTLSFVDGILVATRGLGDDLMAADVAGTRAALSGGQRSRYPRIHGYLDGENRTAFRAFLCDMAAPGTEVIDIAGTRHAVMRWNETCFSTGLRIDNIYWQGEGGTLWRTRQWVGPSPGNIETELLRR